MGKCVDKLAEVPVLRPGYGPFPYHIPTYSS
jgi:hypothetical protein